MCFGVQKSVNKKTNLKVTCFCFESIKFDVDGNECYKQVKNELYSLGGLMHIIVYLCDIIIDSTVSGSGQIFYQAGLQLN